MNFSKKSGKKRAAAAAVICFVAAIAITGTYTFNNYKGAKNENDLAMAEETGVTEDKFIEDKHTEDKYTEDKYTVASEEEADKASVPDEEIEANNKEPEDIENIETEEVSVSNAANVNFSENSKILWPVTGAVLMDYSMDKTVYFKTLDQYKYNPAMIIAAAENDQVIAGATGIVKSIDKSAQTGTTVNVDLGNGYETFYGQLQNVNVKTGDYVDATTIIGYIAEPTKYYSSEGSNLYFEMRKDGRPVDPKGYGDVVK